MGPYGNATNARRYKEANPGKLPLLGCDRRRMHAGQPIRFPGSVVRSMPSKIRLSGMLSGNELRAGDRIFHEGQTARILRVAGDASTRTTLVVLDRRLKSSRF